MLQKGDKVLVCPWNYMAKKYGEDHDGNIPVPYTFVRGMRKYCNTIVTIERRTTGGAYEIEEDEGEFWWSRQMFLLKDSIAYYLVQEESKNDTKRT